MQLGVVIFLGRAVPLPGQCLQVTLQAAIKPHSVLPRPWRWLVGGAGVTGLGGILSTERTQAGNQRLELCSSSSKDGSLFQALVVYPLAHSYLCVCNPPTWAPPPVNLLQRKLHVFVQALDSCHKVDSQPVHYAECARCWTHQGVQQAMQQWLWMLKHTPAVFCGHATGLLYGVVVEKSGANHAAVGLLVTSLPLGQWICTELIPTHLWREGER